MYEVQTQFIYGWENVWECDGKKEYFNSIEEAEQAVKDFFKELKEDNIEEEYSTEDYRIVEVV